MKTTSSEMALLQLYQSLPQQLKQEVLDFVEFVKQKHIKNTEIEGSDKDKKKRKLGYFPKGTFVMSDDFNAPLDDFSEYSYENGFLGDAVSRYRPKNTKSILLLN